MMSMGARKAQLESALANLGSLVEIDSLTPEMSVTAPFSLRGPHRITIHELGRVVGLDNRQHSLFWRGLRGLERIKRTIVHPFPSGFAATIGRFPLTDGHSFECTFTIIEGSQGHPEFRAKARGLDVGACSIHALLHSVWLKKRIAGTEDIVLAEDVFGFSSPILCLALMRLPLAKDILLRVIVKGVAYKFAAAKSAPVSANVNVAPKNTEVENVSRIVHEISRSEVEDPTNSIISKDFQMKIFTGILQRLEKGDGRDTLLFRKDECAQVRTQAIFACRTEVIDMISKAVVTLRSASTDKDVVTDKILEERGDPPTITTTEAQGDEIGPHVAQTDATDRQSNIASKKRPRPDAPASIPLKAGESSEERDAAKPSPTPTNANFVDLPVEKEGKRFANGVTILTAQASDIPGQFMNSSIPSGSTGREKTAFQAPDALGVQSFTTSKPSSDLKGKMNVQQVKLDHEMTSDVNVVEANDREHDNRALAAREHKMMVNEFGSSHRECEAPAKADKTDAATIIHSNTEADAKASTETRKHRIRSTGNLVWADQRRGASIKGTSGIRHTDEVWYEALEESVVLATSASLDRRPRALRKAMSVSGTNGCRQPKWMEDRSAIADESKRHKAARLPPRIVSKRLASAKQKSDPESAPQAARVRMQAKARKRKTQGKKGHWTLDKDHGLVPAP